MAAANIRNKRPWAMRTLVALMAMLVTASLLAGVALIALGPAFAGVAFDFFGAFFPVLDDYNGVRFICGEHFCRIIIGRFRLGLRGG